MILDLDLSLAQINSGPAAAPQVSVALEARPIDLHLESSPHLDIELGGRQITVSCDPSPAAGQPVDPGTTTTDLQYRANASPISGHRVVQYDPITAGWIYADRTRADSIFAKLAVTLGGISFGALGPARLSGIMDEPTWSWPAPCALWLDLDGYLTATPPAAGFEREVARAITPTRISIQDRPAILLI